MITIVNKENSFNDMSKKSIFSKKTMFVAIEVYCLNITYVKRADNIYRLKQNIILNIENGTNINIKNNEDETILLICCNKNIRIIEFLINLGADANIYDISLNTPFMIACWRGYLKMVKLLIPITENINKLSIKRWNSIMAAAHNGHTNVVNYLLNFKICLNQQTSKNDNALILAAWNGHLDILKLLIEKGKVCSC